MSERRVFHLAHAEARKRACQAVAEAADGWRVTVEPPTRSTDQNSMLWPLLTAFAEQLEWPVNGRMTKLTPDDWKALLSAAFKQESQRVAMGLNGGMVMLGLRTSRMSKPAFSEFLEFILATAADRGVVLEEVEA